MDIRRVIEDFYSGKFDSLEENVRAALSGESEEATAPSFYVCGNCIYYREVSPTAGACYVLASIGGDKKPVRPSDPACDGFETKSGERKPETEGGFDEGAGWIPVTSSCLAAVMYDALSADLSLEFVSGSVYRYHGVPLAIYDSLMRAASKGSAFRCYIRDFYSYDRES